MSGFEIYAGLAGSGKTYELCERLLREAHDHPERSFVVIIPEQAANAYEKKLIEMNMRLFGRGGFMNIDILGFNRLAYRIFEELGVRDTAVLEEYEKNMLVRLAAGRVGKKLQVYASSIDRMGFISKTKSFISELIQYGITPEDLDKVTDGLSANESLALKLTDVNTIYREFLSLLGSQPMGISEDRLKVLTAKLMEKRDCSVTDGTVFIFDEYRGYTPDQLKVISALGRRAENMIFSLCIDPEIIKEGKKVKQHELFHQSYETYRALLLALGEKPEFTFTSEEKVNALSHLRRHVLRFPPREFSGETHGLRVISMRNTEEELRVVASDIRKKIKAGYRFKDIAVVTADTENFESFGGEVFREYGISYFADYNRALRKNPYTEAMIRMLDVVDNGYSYDSVFGLLKSGVFKDLDRREVNLLENFVISKGIRGRKLWEKVFPQISIISPIADIGYGNHTVSEYISALRQITDGVFDFKNSMDKDAEYLEEIGRLTDASVMRSLYAVFDQLLSQTDEFLGEIQMKLHDFSELIQSAADSLAISIIPPVIDAVHIADISRSRILSAKVVYLIGVNDGIIPTSGSASRLLSDKERDQVIAELGSQGEGKRLAGTSMSQSVDELFLIYQILSKPTDELVISYVQADMAGNAFEPSFIIGRVIRLFPELLVEDGNTLSTEGTPESDRIDYITEMRDALEMIHEVDDLEKFASTAEGKIYKDHINSIAKYERNVSLTEGTVKNKELIDGGMDFSNVAQDIPLDVMENINLKLSVSKIEKYQSCPYSFFMQYILGLSRRLESEIDSMDVGNIMHSTIEKTFKQISRENGNDWKGIEDKTLLSIMQENLDKVWAEKKGDKDEETITGRELQVYNNLCNLSKRTILMLRRHIVAGEMLPDRFEQEFKVEYEATGPDGDKLPITLLGKIDRIDTKEEGDNLYIRIIDYKTGSQGFDPMKIREGTDIQLPLYMKYITELIKSETKKNVIPAGMYFYHVDDPICKAASSKRIGEIGEEAAQAELTEKELKMKGVSNEDPPKKDNPDEQLLYAHRLLNLQDRGLVIPETGTITGESKVVPVSVDSHGEYKTTAIVADTKTIQDVCEYSKDILVKGTEDIMMGKIDKSPIKYPGFFGAGHACTYCDFRTVCRFNSTSGEERRVKKPDLTIKEQLEAFRTGGDSDASVE